MIFLLIKLLVNDRIRVKSKESFLALSGGSLNQDKPSKLLAAKWKVPD